MIQVNRRSIDCVLVAAQSIVNRHLYQNALWDEKDLDEPSNDGQQNGPFSLTGWLKGIRN